MSEHVDEVIPPLPPELVEFAVDGLVVEIDGNPAPAVAIQLRGLDGDPVSYVASVDAIETIEHGLREARREARRKTNLARTRKDQSR